MSYKSFFRIQLSNLKQNAVTVLGLSVSLTAIIFSIAYLVFENSYDSFWPGSERIHIIKTDVHFESGRQVVSTSTSHLVKEYLELHSTGIENVCRTKSISDFISFGQSSFEEDIIFADPEYLEIFGIKAIAGSSENFGEPDRALVTDVFAKKAGGLNRILGSTITYQGRSYTIAGLVKASPSNSTQVFDIVLPLRNYVLDNDPGPYFLPVKTYVKTMEKDSGLDEIGRTASEYYISRGSSNTRCFTFPLTDIYSLTEDKQSKSGSAFVIVAVFVLAMSVINFSNKFAARTEQNIKGLAIRKSFGASLSRLLSLIFSDAAVITVCSLLMGLIICDITLEAFRNLIGIDLLILGKGLILTPLLMLLLLLLLSFIVSIPSAIRFASRTVTRILSQGSKSTERLLSLRKIPLVFQFCVSLTLIAILILQSMQMSYLNEFDYGIDPENRMIVSLSRNLWMGFDRYSNEIKSVPGVISISGKTTAFGDHYGADIRMPGWDNNTKLEAYGYSVQDAFFDVMGIEIIDGLSFADLPGYDSSKVIIDTYTASLLGLENPVGSIIRDDFITCEIIGLAENASFVPHSFEKRPVIYNQIKKYSSELVIHCQGKPEQIMKAVGDILGHYDPDYILNYQAMEDRVAAFYSSERNSMKLISWLTVLAILLCLSGVYSIVSHRIEAERKNISIKKIMGASKADLNLFFGKELLLLIFTAALVAFPLAMVFSAGWLSSYVSRIVIGPVPFILSLLLLLLLTALIVYLKQAKITSINPVRNLGSE